MIEEYIHNATEYYFSMTGGREFVFDQVKLFMPFVANDFGLVLLVTNI